MITTGANRSSKHGTVMSRTCFHRAQEGGGGGRGRPGAFWLGVALLAGTPAASVSGGQTTILPPVGPYVRLSPAEVAAVPSYHRTNRLVLTPYFYWYDVTTGAHVIDADGTDALTDHPPTLEGFTWRSPAWHEQQLRDMIDAGIDVLLPVYWGAPSERIEGRLLSEQPWSYAGVPPLVQAREKLLREGLKPPRIGLFYDTSTLQYNRWHRRIDLTTDFGKAWFYESVRDFFSLIPPKHWAMIDGRPLVFLYSAVFAADYDQGCIDHLKAAFARDFGGCEPYLVREVSWRVQTEEVYTWGGALGLKNPGVASLGPGYDHSAVPGRTPLVVDREGGAFFERNWTRLLRRPSHLVFIETWNEYHEGTDIAASREYGRQYIELNRRYADWFRAGYVPPMPPGPYTGAQQVWVELGPTNRTHGVVQVESADGVTAPAEVGGRPCRSAQPTVHRGRYIYFRIDDSFKWADPMEVEVEVLYFDHAEGRFGLEYDGSDPNAPFSGAYTRAGKTVALRGTGTWQTGTFRLAGARFLNGQNAGADFRLVVEAPVFHVARVEVRRLAGGE